MPEILPQKHPSLRIMITNHTLDVQYGNINRPVSAQAISHEKTFEELFKVGVI